MRVPLLQSNGLVSQQANELVIRNPLYKSFFEKELSNNRQEPYLEYEILKEDQLPIRQELKKLTAQEVTMFVNTLLKCPSMADSSTRDVILRELPKTIYLSVARHNAAYADVMSIVQQCLLFEEGLDQLVQAVGLFDSYTKEYAVLLDYFQSLFVNVSDRGDLLILLEQVKKFWIEGVLEESLDKQLMINVDITLQPDAIDHPWGKELNISKLSENKNISPDKSLLEIFNELGRNILILGEPRSGKTTKMLSLAKILIEEAENDPNTPIPVVFRLFSWTEKRKPLEKWLIDEFVSKYKVPTRFCKRWLEEGRLLLLLDGLDEVKDKHRNKCVKAINIFQETYGANGLVVCSLRAEYEALPIKLNLSGAILLNRKDRQGEILWVDDRPHNNIYERQAFESMNLNITLALSTNEALKKLSKKEFDVIISDMGRREGPREGYVLLDALRQQGNQTPFFIYAGSNALKHKLETEEHGGQGTTNYFQELSQMVINAINSSELDNQTSLDKATIFPLEKVLSKEECLKMVCEEIKNLLTPSSASLVRRAISKTILETYQRTIDDPIGIAKFIVNLHDNESKQYAHSIVEKLLVPAIKKFDPLEGDFYNELKQDNNSTNETVKELFYLLLGWIVHITVADQEEILFDEQSETFNLAVSTKVGVEILMARFSGRGATFINHSHPKQVQGQGGFNINIENFTSPTARRTASNIALDLWNRVFPEKMLEKEFSLTDEERTMLVAQIESRQNAKVIHYYAMSKVSLLKDEVFKEVAKELSKLVPGLALVGFGDNDKASIFPFEYELVASIQTFSEVLERAFLLEF